MTPGAVTRTPCLSIFGSANAELVSAAGVLGLHNLVKFRFAKPVDIRLPTAKWAHINPKPMGEAIPDVPLDKVMVCPPAEIPRG